MSKKCCIFAPQSMCNQNSTIRFNMRPIHFYTIKSSGGLKVKICNLGAKIAELLVANRKGEVKDVAQ